MDERFKNAGKAVWVWDDEKQKCEGLKRVLIAENEDGSCVCIVNGNEHGRMFGTTFWDHYSFTDPSKKEYEPYGAGEMPQLDWVVAKKKGIKLLVSGYDPNGDEQLCVNGFWKLNKEIFDKFTDTNGNPIGKENNGK